MVPLTSLWLPILLSAVFVFVASWLMHMVLGYHRADYGKIVAEDELMDAVRKFNLAPGDYMVPCASGPQDMKNPVFIEKMKKGPKLMMTVLPPGIGFGKQLVQWFLYCILVGVFAAYVTSRAVSPGTDYLHVFRFAGVTSFTAYALALWQDSIWYGRRWSTTMRYTIDALVFSGLTAGTFGWLWPK